MPKIKQVYATLDSRNEFEYVDLFDTKEEAEAKIGVPRADGLIITGTSVGYCIAGDDGFCLDESEDWYKTAEEAQAALERIAARIPLESMFEELLKPTEKYRAVSYEVCALMEDLYQKMYDRGVLPHELTLILISQANYVGAKLSARHRSLNP